MRQLALPYPFVNIQRMERNSITNNTISIIKGS